MAGRRSTTLEAVKGREANKKKNVVNAALLVTKLRDTRSAIPSTEAAASLRLSE